MKKGFNAYFWILILIILLAIWISYTSRPDSNNMLETIYDAIENQEIESVVTIYPGSVSPTGTVETVIDGVKVTAHVTNVDDVAQMCLEKNVPVYVTSADEGSWMDYLIPVLIGIGVVMFLFILFTGTVGGGAGGGGSANSRMMNFGKSRAQKIDETNKTFKDVAGLHEEKEDLEEIVDFLKQPARYTALGARIPKGILLEGHPGTGKTLLAKAVAGEAGVPFFSISGSDFVEMFVGVGASRVRDLFADAKKNAPCIVFIDEIDAVARRRGTGLGGGHDEREQTLNQLLVEMDGFEENSGIIVLAATNRVDILDPAILRPGRFDRKIAVSLPDVKAREEILNVHSRNKSYAEDVNLSEIARITAGFSGADLENLLNESAIKAVREKRKFIVDEDIKKSLIKVGIGTEKKSHLVSDKEKKVVAFHEAGHALLFHLLPDVGPVYAVSIIPTGSGAGGYTMPLPEKDEMLLTKSRIRQDIMVTLGGRIAEEIEFGDITTGASSDIKKATRAARNMVTKYGMSEKIGTIAYGSDDDEVFIGRDMARAKNYSERMTGEIDEEVKTIIDECYAEAKRIILENRDVLKACADLLIEKERINQQEFEALFVQN